MAWGQPVGVLADVERLVAPVVRTCDLVFWGCEWANDQSARVLRIYIDSIDSEQGVSVDDCAVVSRQVSPLLDVEAVIPGEYNLEVSSPGMERPLFTLAQCEAYCGETIRLALKQPIDDLKKKAQGILKTVEDSAVVVLVQDTAYRVPADAIHKMVLWPF
ncbi:MAG: ribosome maturation factor RimP [Gammaproteobacteria bacterium]